MLSTRWADPPALLFRPQLSIGDGSLAFMHKIAQQNSVSRGFLRRVGIDFVPTSLARVGCLRQDSDRDRLVQFVSALAEARRRWPHAWLHRRSRFCPVCLRESGRWRVDWEIRFADACRLHGVWLIDECGCGRPLTWERADLSFCVCGRRLVDMRASPCPPSVSVLSAALIFAGCGVGEGCAASMIKDLDFGGLHSVIWLLGRYATACAHWDPRRPPEDLRRSWTISSAAAAVVEGWPDSFFRVLDVYCSRSRRSSVEGQMLGTFGALYTTMYRGHPEQYQILREAFETFIRERWTGALGLRNRRLSANTIKAASWVSISKVAPEAKLRRRAAVEGLESMGVPLARRTTRSGRTYVMALRNGPEITLRRSSLCLKEAAAQLGLSKRRMHDLALRQILPASRRAGFGSVWALDAETWKTLMEPLASAPTLYARPPGSVRLDHVLRFWRWPAAWIGEVIGKLLAGEVAIAGRVPGTIGCRGLLLSVDELRRIEAGLRRVQPSDRVSIPAAAEQLGVKQQVAYDLVRRQLLRTVSARDPSGRLVRTTTARDIDAFRAEYVFGREVARQLGCTPRVALRELTSLGATPASGPGVDGCRQVVFRRDSNLATAVRALTAAQASRELCRLC